MFSRRDKLLILPWEQRRYENHIRKVQSALPAIDNRPPLSRNHVAIKLKRSQKESERCSQIEKNNLILLQKLNSIMLKNRVDNYWVTPQPNFLNRVGIYGGMKSAEEKHKTERQISRDLTMNDSTIRLRKVKCLACSPKVLQDESVYEERIPWEPTKPPVRKPRSKSVPPQKISILPTVKECSSASSKVSTERKSPTSTVKNNERSKSSKTTNSRKVDKNFNDSSPQSIILSRGSLVLSVNFPSDTFVKFQNGTSEKLINRGLCQCKNEEENFQLKV